MIINIADLCNYQRELCERIGGDAYKDFLISKKTMGVDRIKYLHENLPNLPKSYLDIIQEYDIYEKSIGFFSLSPVDLDTKDIVEVLVKANTVYPFIPKDFLDKKGLIWIGSNNDYTVYVAKGAGDFLGGEIILIDEEILVDIDNPGPNDIQLLAKDFEQFLILAGNFNQVKKEVLRDQSNYIEKKQEFQERFKKLKVDEKYHNVWLSLF